MSGRIGIVAVLTVSLAVLFAVLFGGCHAMHEKHNAAIHKIKVGGGSSSAELTERRELHQTYELAPGAKVSLLGIAGTVEIETGNSTNAEVSIVESAVSQEDLNSRHIDIQQTADKLELKSLGERRGFWSLFGHSGMVRQQVKLKLPAQVDLTLRGIIGPVTATAIQGPLHITGVDGNVNVAGAAQSVGISGVNGNLTVNMSKLGEKGMSINGINGNIDLGLESKLNALFRVSAVNGKIEQDIPNLNVFGEQRRGNLDAQAGTGGTLIRISGVNGNVHLLSPTHQAT
jgi:hypothetical protein